MSGSHLQYFEADAEAIGVDVVNILTDTVACREAEIPADRIFQADRSRRCKFRSVESLIYGTQAAREQTQRDNRNDLFDVAIRGEADAAAEQVKLITACKREKMVTGIDTLEPGGDSQPADMMWSGIEASGAEELWRAQGSGVAGISCEEVSACVQKS